MARKQPEVDDDSDMWRIFRRAREEPAPPMDPKRQEEARKAVEEELRKQHKSDKTK